MIHWWNLLQSTATAVQTKCKPHFFRIPQNHLSKGIKFYAETICSDDNCLINSVVIDDARAWCFHVDVELARSQSYIQHLYGHSKKAARMRIERAKKRSNSHLRFMARIVFQQLFVCMQANFLLSSILVLWKRVTLGARRCCRAINTLP